MVCGASSVIVRSAVRLMVLKSAVLPSPSATLPPNQLLESLQLPLASAVQVPLTAAAGVAPASGELPLTPPGPAAVTT